MNIMQKTLVSVATLFLVTACSNHDEHQSHEKEHNNHSVHWGYEGKGGPYTWGSLDPSFRLCSVGKMQTPINIIPTKNIDLPELNLTYEASSKNVINNGHSIQVNVNHGSSLLLDGTRYELKQFHFHTPSENNLYGESFPLEAHFVHVSESGKIAVIGVMFKKGAQNPILSKIWSKFPLAEGSHKPVHLSAEDIQSIMPKDREYYKFMGSLTTPPCTENVHWIVYKEPVTISKEQVRRFFNIFGHPNNRPIQKSNDRMIYR